MNEGPLVGQAVQVRARNDVMSGVVYSAAGPHILLSLGRFHELPAALTVGTGVRLRYSTSLGLHEMATEIVSVGGQENVTLALAHSRDGQTIQRRNYFRVPACLSVAVNFARSGYLDPRAITQDISAGGMRLETALRGVMGDYLELVVQTPRNFRRRLPAELICRGRVVRILEQALRGARYSSFGVEFAFDLERERDRWVQLSFDLQRGVQI